MRRGRLEEQHRSPHHLECQRQERRRLRRGPVRGEDPAGKRTGLQRQGELRAPGDRTRRQDRRHTHHLPHPMTEEKAAKKSWDLTKAVTPLLTVLGISVGAWQFTSQMSHESEMEFSRSLYNKKLQAYEAVGKAVGDLLVVPHDEQLWISAEDTL